MIATIIVPLPVRIICFSISPFPGGGIAHVLGSLGVFYLYLTVMGLSGASTYAIVFLGSATGIILTSGGGRRLGR